MPAASAIPTMVVRLGPKRRKWSQASSRILWSADNSPERAEARRHVSTSPVMSPLTTSPRPCGSAIYSAERISDQARDGAREFKRLAALLGAVEQLRLRFRGGDQFDLLVVERVDQVDEPLRLVALLGPDDRDIVHDEHVESLGDGQEVGGAERLLAQIGIVEARDMAGGLGHGDLAPQQGQANGQASLDARQRAKGLVEGRARGRHRPACGRPARRRAFRAGNRCANRA